MQIKIKNRVESFTLIEIEGRLKDLTSIIDYINDKHKVHIYRKDATTLWRLKLVNKEMFLWQEIHYLSKIGRLTQYAAEALVNEYFEPEDLGITTAMISNWSVDPSEYYIEIMMDVAGGIRDAKLWFIPRFAQSMTLRKEKK